MVFNALFSFHTSFQMGHPESRHISLLPFVFSTYTVLDKKMFFIIKFGAQSSIFLFLMCQLECPMTEQFILPAPWAPSLSSWPDLSKFTNSSSTLCGIQGRFPPLVVKFSIYIIYLDIGICVTKLRPYFLC